jgi:predicted 2-oxoglutarate/Fe(II)-dependent dioxygenase YbiX
LRSLKIDLDHHKNILVPSTDPWSLYVDKQEPFAYAESAFTLNQCKSIIAMGNKLNLKEACVGTDENVNQSIRNCRTSVIPAAKCNHWIFEKIADCCRTLNSSFYNFHLSSLIEGIQFIKYDAPDGGYKPHVDSIYGGVIRKLSISVQLSDGDEYEGGELIVHDGRELVLPRSVGTVAVFPSYALHEVRPITKGTRYSLVAWVTGDAFK